MTKKTLADVLPEFEQPKFTGPKLAGIPPINNVLDKLLNKLKGANVTIFSKHGGFSGELIEFDSHGVLLDSSTIYDDKGQIYVGFAPGFTICPYIQKQKGNW